MFAAIKALLTNKAGVTSFEYGLIAALIAVVAVTVIGTLGPALKTAFTSL